MVVRVELFRSTLILVVEEATTSVVFIGHLHAKGRVAEQDDGSVPGDGEFTEYQKEKRKGEKEYSYHNLLLLLYYIILYRLGTNATQTKKRDKRD